MRRDLSGVEERLRDPLHVAGGHRFDALHQFVQREEAAEVHLLARQVRHAAGGGFQAQHQRALQMVLGPPQFFLAHRLLLELAELAR